MTSYIVIPIYHVYMYVHTSICMYVCCNIVNLIEKSYFAECMKLSVLEISMTTFVSHYGTEFFYVLYVNPYQQQQHNSIRNTFTQTIFILRNIYSSSNYNFRCFSIVLHLLVLTAVSFLTDIFVIQSNRHDSEKSMKLCL